MNNTIYYYINNKFVKSDQARIPFNDTGFLYGDGLFETMRFDNKRIFSPLKHINRIIKSLKIVDFKIDQSDKEIYNLLELVIDKNKLNSGIIRLMITRGIANKNTPAIYISIKPFYEIPKDPVRVIYLKESKFPIIRFSPAIKSMNYLGNMLAKKESKKQNAFEPVFYNKEGIITECAIRNIFYFKKNILYTPSLDLGILPGVMRDTIIDIAKSIGMQIKETHIKHNSIDEMDESFISSTGIGLLECYWDEWKSDYFMTKQIKKELFKRINNN